MKRKKTYQKPHISKSPIKTQFFISRLKDFSDESLLADCWWKSGGSCNGGSPGCC